jgi:hypothetical protein
MGANPRDLILNPKKSSRCCILTVFKGVGEDKTVLDAMLSLGEEDDFMAYLDLDGGETISGRGDFVIDDICKEGDESAKWLVE